MTRTTNSRLAGFAFLFYIAVGIASMILYGKATRGEETAARIAHVAEHAMDVRLTILFTLLSGFSALVLAVTLYGITRDEDHELAMMGLVCRVAEGVIGCAGLSRTVSL